MRENRQSGSEGGGAESNRLSLPLLRYSATGGSRAILRSSADASILSDSAETETEWRGNRESLGKVRFEVPLVSVSSSIRVSADLHSSTEDWFQRFLCSRVA